MHMISMVFFHFRPKKLTSETQVCFRICAIRKDGTKLEADDFLLMGMFTKQEKHLPCSLHFAYRGLGINYGEIVAATANVWLKDFLETNSALLKGGVIQ